MKTNFPMFSLPTRAACSEGREASVGNYLPYTSRSATDPTKLTEEVEDLPWPKRLLGFKVDCWKTPAIGCHLSLSDMYLQKRYHHNSGMLLIWIHFRVLYSTHKPVVT